MKCMHECWSISRHSPSIIPSDFGTLILHHGRLHSLPPSAMTSLWQTLNEKKARLDALRPLRAASIHSLMEALDVELVYSSNAVEGNTLTLQETSAVLLHGVTVAGKPLRDHLEAVHLASAWQRVKELAQSDGGLTEDELLELHTLVLGKDDPAAGHYRSVPVFIRGSKHVPPNALKVSDRMVELFPTDRAGEHVVEQAANIHEALVTIHPFVDGNGRTARLVMNLLLMRAGFPPLRIQPEQRALYFTALDESRFGKREAFAEWIAQLADTELTFWLTHLEG